MKYENPLPKEGINVSKRNHLVDFLVLSVGTIVAIAVITFVVGLFAGFLAKRIPFEQELKFSQPFESLDDSTHTEQDDYLRNLVASLEKCADLPQGMHIKYHYSSDEMVNAFATLGGNIIVFQGLLDELDNENQLAMIIAHEIGHIKHRHPIQSIGRGVIVGITLSLLMGNSVTNPLEKAGLLTMLKFGRGMETQADNDGLKTLERCYGHVNGAANVFAKFQKMQNQNDKHQLPFLSTHPLNSDRIENIETLANENHWSTTGVINNFPKSMTAKD